jgi:uncharacterized protein YndB with AHSA1/START domain
MAKEFESRRDVDLPATPEEVWDAVATSGGVRSWLFPTEAEPRVGGATSDGGKVTAYDPPNHFAARTEGPDGWFSAIEFRIEGKDDGTTLLRYVHSGIFVDDWEAQYDAVSQHNDFYLHTLAQYLEHFAPRVATYVGGGPGGVMGPEGSMTPDAFDKLQRALGVPEDASEGDTVTIGPEGVEGVIDYRRGNFLGIRTDSALYRFFGRNAFGGPVGMSVHDFSDGADAQSSEQKWSSWLEKTYS